MIPYEALTFPIDSNLISYPDIINGLAIAERSLGAFNERVFKSDLQDAYTLIHLVKLESLYSTKIEGTQTTLEEVYEFDADTQTTSRSKDLEEVIRYQEALKYASNECRNNPITNKIIKQIHYLLLQGDVRKNSNFQAGEFRTQQNMVDKHVPPKAVDVPILMGNLERYINDDLRDDLPVLIKVALIHAQFETIHPFPDGNGRVGRVLIPLYLYKQGYIKSPHFFLSQELEKNKFKYYSYLQGTRTKTVEGYTKWLNFFFSSVKMQAERGIQFVNLLEALYEKVVNEVQHYINSNNVHSLVDAIFRRPYFTCDTLYNETGISPSTLRRYVKLLYEHGIIYPCGSRLRNKIYVFLEMADLLNHQQ